MTRDKAMRAARETHTVLDPRSIGVALEVVEAGELVVEQRAAAPAVAKPTSARVPEWVQHPEKWQSMTRAERRAVERHHRRQLGR